MATILPDLILTFMTIIFYIFASLISLIVFIIIIIHLCFNQTKKEDKVTFILSANILIFMFVHGVIAISFCINTILGKLYGYNFESSSWCISSGYLILVISFAIYTVFVSQAIFRLFRIVYSSYKKLQLFWLYIFAGPIGLIFGFVVSSPLLIWNDIKYLPTEHYCFASFSSLRGMLWMTGGVYGLPLLTLLIIYIRVTIFIHYQSNNRTHITQCRQKRDLIVIQRIMTTVSILTIGGIPTMILLIITNITGVEPPLINRIQWIMTSASLAVLSITTVMFTPQLKQIVLNKWRRNQVGYTTNNEVENNIPIRTIE